MADTDFTRMTDCFGGCGTQVSYKTSKRVYCAPCRLEAKRAKDVRAAEKQRRKKGIAPVKGTSIACLDCKQEFVRFSHRSVRCKPCQGEFVLEKARQASRAKAEARGAIKVGTILQCQHCGVDFKKVAAVQVYCLDCREIALKGQLPAYREAQKRWADQNREYLREQNRKYHKERRQADPEGERQRYRDYYEANKEKVYRSVEKYRSCKRVQAKLAEARRLREKRLHREDPLFRTKKLARHAIWRAINEKGYTKRSRTTEILGCDWETFYEHIEQQFTNGMTWDKMGSEIHLDHIIPLAAAETEDDVLALSHFTNLRPLWAKDNIDKRDKRLHLI